MPLIHAKPADVQRYPLATLATQIRVVEFTLGALFRIVDPEHTHFGQVGQLEFTKDTRSWLKLSGLFVEVPLTALAPVEAAIH